MSFVAVSSWTGNTKIFDTIPDTGDNYAIAMTEYLLPKNNVDYVT